MGDLTTEIQSTAGASGTRYTLTPEFDGIVKALGATQLLVIGMSGPSWRRRPRR